MEKLNKSRKKIIFGTVFLIGNSDTVGFYVNVRVDVCFESYGTYYTSCVDVVCKTGQFPKLAKETIIIDDGLTLYDLKRKYKKVDKNDLDDYDVNEVDRFFSEIVFPPEKRKKLSIFLFKKYEEGEIKISDVDAKVKNLIPLF